MHTRRLVKRSVLGSRVHAPSPTEDGAPVTGVVQAVKQDNREAPAAAGGRRSVYAVLMQDGGLKEFAEEEIATGFSHPATKGPLKSSLKVSFNRFRRRGERNRVAAAAAAAGAFVQEKASRTTAAVRDLASNCGLSRRLATADMRDKGLDSACAMFMWAVFCLFPPVLAALLSPSSGGPPMKRAERSLIGRLGIAEGSRGHGVAGSRVQQPPLPLVTALLLSVRAREAQEPIKRPELVSEPDFFHPNPLISSR
ncbi:Zinc finger protein 704 [Takifugu flavidus]|uniref:Zinc finger protein 704 n=1 Tax=Takifugu flavidus TaxID=433684 RepID=A0A5C6NGH3_9TELE|nr:Zinc finger protein 704 [Takifugu flavidus]